MWDRLLPAYSAQQNLKEQVRDRIANLEPNTDPWEPGWYLIEWDWKKDEKALQN